MSLDVIITRFVVYGFALGAIIGFIGGWNRKILEILFMIYFAALVVGGLTLEPSTIANSAAPSVGAVIAQMFGALLGYLSGRNGYRQAFEE